MSLECPLESLDRWQLMIPKEVSKMDRERPTAPLLGALDTSRSTPFFTYNNNNNINQ